MNRENTRALFSKFPFFYPESSLRESSMAFGFECGDGWYKLLLKLCNKIQDELNKPCDKLKENFRVVLTLCKKCRSAEKRKVTEKSNW